MSTQQQIIAIWVGCLLGGLALIPYFLRKAKRKASGATEKFSIIKVEKKYQRYSTNFLTRKRFNTIIKSYQALSCMTEPQVKNKSVKIFEKAIKVSTAIPVFLLITTRDPIVALLGVLISLVYYTITVEKDIDEMYRVIVKEVSELVQSISLNYMEYNNIPRSVLEGDRGEYLAIIVDEMYSILTDVNSKKRLNDFIAKSPLKLLCELVEICQITNDHGDSFNDRGESKFIEQLGVIEKEVNLEIRTLHIQKMKFNMLDKVALAGIILMPIVDWYLLDQIPGTAIIVKGVMGLSIKVFIMLLTIAAYYVISTINKKSVVSSTDFSEMVYQISQEKRCKKFIDTIKPKAYKNVIKVEATLEESLSSHTVDTFYAAKAFYMAFMAVLGLVLAIAFVFTAKAAIYNNTGTLSFIPILVEKRVQEDIDIMDGIYMKMDEKPRGDDLLNFVEDSVRNLNMLDIQDQAKRLQKKWDTYTSIQFQWYYIIVIYLMGVVGWFIPNLQIKLRKFMVKFEAEDDASQLQTVMITLAGTGLSVYEVLHRLLDLSTIHKSSISYACQTFVRDPEFSLDILSENSRVPEFKRMCTKLKKAIYNLPIQDAFRNIVVEKEQSLALKEMDAVNMVNKKANLANLLAAAPVACVLILQTLLPLMILGFSQILDMQSTLGGM